MWFLFFKQNENSSDILYTIKFNLSIFLFCGIYCLYKYCFDGKNDRSKCLEVHYLFFRVNWQQNFAKKRGCIPN